MLTLHRKQAMTLYKYLHPDRTDVLRNGKIRFSPPKVLNDPFEMRPHLSHTEIAKIFEVPGYSKIHKFKEMIGNAVSTTMRQTQRAIADAFNQFGVLCLTESRLNLPMWAHYADSHQGFVIEFDDEDPYFHQRQLAGESVNHLRQVIYQKSRPSLKLNEVGDFSYLFMKSQDWESEQEWRMIFLLSSASQVIGSGDAAVHLFDFPRAAIRSVTLGCRMQDGKRDEIHQILRTTPGLEHVKCFQAEIDEQHFSLNFAEVAP